MRRLDRGEGTAPAARLSRPCTGRPRITVRAALRPLCLEWLDGERGERGESPRDRERVKPLRLVRGSTVPGTEKPSNGAPGGVRAIASAPAPKARSD